MTERDSFEPVSDTHLEDEEVFAALVRLKLKVEERSWPWLSRRTNVPENTLRSQLVDKPDRLKLYVARRVSTALAIPGMADGEQLRSQLARLQEAVPA